jgi:muramoyltetrapeptide carboxypeptidase
MGVFGKIQGAIIGYIDGVDNLPDAALYMQDVLLNVAGDYRFPILKVNDFGHNCPNTILPVGARVRMDADDKEIEILEECVNH